MSLVHAPPMIVPGFVAITPSNPTGNATTTNTMMGLGAAGFIYTPRSTGRLLIMVSGTLSNTTGNGSKVQIAYGTGTPPANAAVASGTLIGNIATVTSLTGVLAQGFALAYVLQIPPSGVGVPLWFDLQFAAVTGGTATPTALAASVIEV